jgi:hypothetical protein
MRSKELQNFYNKLAAEIYDMPNRFQADEDALYELNKNRLNLAYLFIERFEKDISREIDQYYSKVVNTFVLNQINQHILNIINTFQNDFADSVLKNESRNLDNITITNTLVAIQSMLDYCKKLQEFAEGLIAKNTESDEGYILKEVSDDLVSLAKTLYSNLDFISYRTNFEGRNNS